MRRIVFIGGLAALGATASVAIAQAVIRSMRLGTFVPYGLDAVRIRIKHVEVYRFHQHRGPPDHPALPVPRSDTGYLFLTLEARNGGAVPENIPLLQVNGRIDGRSCGFRSLRRRWKNRSAGVDDNRAASNDRAISRHRRHS